MRISIYETTRQEKKCLKVAGKTAVHDLDCLIAAGCVEEVEMAYSFGHELRGLSPAHRGAVGGGGMKWRRSSATQPTGGGPRPLLPVYLGVVPEEVRDSSDLCSGKRSGRTRVHGPELRILRELDPHGIVEG